MRKAVYETPCNIIIQETPKPMISSPSDVLVRICYAGICDDDLPFFLKDDSLITWPLPTAIAGHEFSGIIEGLGEDAKRNGFCIGDRVSGHAWSFCGSCTNCKSGNQNHCTNIKCSSIFVDYAVLDQKQIVKLPDSIDLAHGIFTDPVSYCLYNCMKKILPNRMKNILIFGTNTMSLIVLQIAKRFGAQHIVVATSDLNHSTLFYDLGANEVLNLDNSFASKALKLTKNKGYDLIFEVSRNAAMIAVASQIIGIKGTILYSYMYEFGAESKLNLMEMYLKEAELHPFFLAGHTLPAAIDMMETMPLGKMIGKAYSFEKINDAFEMHLSNKYVKVILDMRA